MRRLSSKNMWVLKRLFPILWFVFVASLMMVPLTMAILNNEWTGVAIAFTFGGIMIGGGIFMMKMLVFNLVDEVWDEGDHLVVRKARHEERIPFAKIMNVSYLPGNPDRITLTLREPCLLGNEIAFTPAPPRAVFFNPFYKNPVVHELMERVDAARRGAQAPESTSER